MAVPLYRAILKQAWQITTRFKALWLFGFLATFLGMGGEYQFLINQYINFSDGGWEEILGITNFFHSETLWLIQNAITQIPPRGWIVLILLLALFCSFVWVIVSAQGALVRGAGSAVKNSQVPLGKEFKIASRSFWPLIGITLGTRLLAFFVFSVIALPLIALLLAIDEAYVSPGAALLFFVLGLPLAMIFSLIAKLAVAYHLIDGRPWREAVARAMSLFGSHWLVCAELALILLPIGLIMAIFFVPLASLLSLPFLVFGLAVAGLSSAVVVKVFFAFALVLFLALLLVLGSALAAFQSIAWTVLFIKIKEAPAQSKLIRILHNWRERYHS